MEIEFKKKKPLWKPPLRCRIFKHDFKETVYMVTIIPGIMEHPLEVCTRCHAGKVHELFGVSFYEPKGILKFIEAEKKRRKKKVEPKVEGNLIKGDFQK